MLVLGELTPHTTVDAVAEAGNVWDRRAFGGWGHGAEDELGRGHLGQVFQEEGLPWCRRGGEVVSGGRHGAEELVEAETRAGYRSYGCWSFVYVGKKIN